jgi:hypothetical protein
MNRILLGTRVCVSTKLLLTEIQILLLSLDRHNGQNKNTKKSSHANASHSLSTTWFIYWNSRPRFMKNMTPESPAFPHTTIYDST